MRKNILMLIAIISLTSCTVDDSNWKAVEYSLIGQGDLYGNAEEGIEKSNLVIRDSEAWNELISKMNAVNDVSNTFNETSIDFSKYQIVAVFDQVYGSGGHSIDIINIVENEENMVVVTEVLAQDIATTVMTQPFQIVKLAITEKLVVFD